MIFLPYKILYCAVILMIGCIYFIPVLTVLSHEVVSMIKYYTQ